PTALTAMAAGLAAYLDGREAHAPAPNQEKEPAAQAGAKRSDAMVKASAKADKPGADGKQVVIVTLDIAKGWHTYANPPGLEDLASVQTTVAVGANGKPLEAKVEYPEGKEVKDKVLGNYKVYEDKVTIKATVSRAQGDAGPLEVTVKF